MLAPRPGGEDRPTDTASRSDERAIFGGQLRTLRLRGGLSQEALAERAGLSAATVAALEQGRRHPHPRTAAALADALGLARPDQAALLALASGPAPRPDPPGPPPPSAPTATRPPLPVPPTALIGRDAEVATARALLDPAASAVRLLTLLGPGGVGKTRLALAVADALTGAYPDGVVFVDLAPLHDQRLVPATIARAVEVREAGGRAARELLVEHLRGRQALLVLDNLEHLLEAAPLVAELLEACPRLALLVTSRVALRVRSEQRFLVRPLATPADGPAPLDAIAATAAVRMFVERARAVDPQFALTPDNAAVVAGVCRQLDGMPLAIELAAARLALLRPEALLRRLERRLPLLTHGAPDLPERQQTLRNTLAWSHDLLGTAERALFRRLAVFAGAWTLEAAEAVCEGGVLAADDVLGRLEVLVDNSLVRLVDDSGQDRTLEMQETIREYAEEYLTQSGEDEQTRARHLAWCLSLAHQAAPELTGPHQATWLECLDRVLDNLRAALRWAEQRGQTELGLRLAGALGRFWSTRRYVGEGREWLERFLAPESPVGVPPAVRAQACYAAGLLANIQGDQSQAVLRLEQSIALYRAAGDLVGAVRALNTRGGVTYDQGHLEDAVVLWQRCLTQARAAGDPGEVAHALGNLGEALFHMGDLAGAEAHHQEALLLARQSGHTDLEAMQLGNLGNVARQRGDLVGATALQRQALLLKRALGARRQIAITLADLASIAGAEGRGTRAARLLGAAAALREAIGTPQPVPERAATQQAVAAALAALSEEARAAAFAAGRALALDDAIAYALE